MKHYEDLGTTGVVWKKVKSLFGYEIRGNQHIALAQDNDLITDDKSF